ncbi:Protein MAIN-LIKE 1 [Glycine soja]
MAKFGRPAPEIEGLVAASGLSPLITCSLDTGDRKQMSAFHKETSSFHLPVEEVTITLDDVPSLLHLPILLHVDDAFKMLVELLKVNVAEARAETIQCHDSYVRLSWLCDVYEMKIEVCHWIVAVRAYLLHLLGCTLFANKSATHVHVVFLDALRDLTQSGGYAWGVAALVNMYDNLNDASKSTTRQLAGYITLLQCWIYGYFPSVGSAVPAKDYDERRILLVSTYRRRLDRLTPDVVCWIPYGDHRSFRELGWGPLTVIHRPERVIRQFGYIQTILPHPVASSLFVEEIDDRWMQFGEYIALVGQLCAVPGHCSPDYMDWFYMISHPFMSPAQPGDLPRVSPQPMAAAAPNEADIDVHHDGFVAIDYKLERLLNLRILIEGTEAYTVVEECMGIARSYFGQPTVGHRLRRRRRMDSH